MQTDFPSVTGIHLVESLMPTHQPRFLLFFKTNSIDFAARGTRRALASLEIGSVLRHNFYDDSKSDAISQ
jgi:hypothetical protein